MTMVSIGARGSISPSYVVRMLWDHTSYANAPTRSVLVIHLADGGVERVEHDPARIGWGGVDAYEVERKIMEAWAT